MSQPSPLKLPPDWPGFKLITPEMLDAAIELFRELGQSEQEIQTWVQNIEKLATRKKEDLPPGRIWIEEAKVHRTIQLEQSDIGKIKEVLEKENSKAHAEGRDSMTEAEVIRILVRRGFLGWKLDQGERNNTQASNSKGSIRIRPIM